MAKRALIFALFLSVALSAFTDASAQVAPVAYLETDGVRSCTAFSMATDGSNWITAAHCTVFSPYSELSINGLPAAVKAWTPGVDVITLTGPPSREAFRLGTAPSMGDHVTTRGFMWNGAWVGPMYIPGQIVAQRQPDLKPMWPHVDLITGAGTSGLSGSPVIDVRGNVVGIWVGFPTNRSGVTYILSFEDFSTSVITGMVDITPPRD